MRSKILLSLFVFTLSTALFSQKKKVIYLDTLGQETDFMDLMAIRNTGRYKMSWDESDPKIRYIKMVPNTKNEYDSLRERTKSRSYQPEKIGTTFDILGTAYLDGQNYDKSSFENKIVVVNFWFVGCGPCEIEAPELNALYDKYSNKDEIVFVSFAKSKEKKVLKYLEENEFRYPVIIMSKEMVEKYRIYAYPTNYVVDKSGKIHFASQGIGPGSVSLLEEGIESALNN